jgi:LysR family transcriptional regulator, glycine cleavage system transcriptional activator
VLIYGMTPDRLPAYSTLRAFVAAGRRESLRDAADELGVTPSAVSHQIRILEDWIGHPLFIRAARRVQLTPLGRSLFRRLDAGFGAISAAALTARGRARDQSLRVSTLPLFTSTWLIPRLQRFEDLCAKDGKKVTIEVDTSNALADFGTDGVDVAIRSVLRPPTHLVAHKLLDLRAVPLCTARLAQNVTCAADLSREALIHISARSNGWTRWFEASGMAPVTPKSNMSFDTVPAALEAAAAGRGVVLGLDPIVWDAPQARNLVVPFRGPAVSAGAFYVTYRRSDRSRWAVKRFAEWILGEMQRDARRLSTNSRNAIRKIDSAK